MTHTIDNIEYIPPDAIALYPTAYNASNGLIERVSGSDPIFVYNYDISLFTDKIRDISLAIPQDE